MYTYKIFGSARRLSITQNIIALSTRFETTKANRRRVYTLLRPDEFCVLSTWECTGAASGGVCCKRGGHHARTRSSFLLWFQFCSLLVFFPCLHESFPALKIKKKKGVLDFLPMCLIIANSYFLIHCWVETQEIIWCGRKDLNFEWQWYLRQVHPLDFMIEK